MNRRQFTWAAACICNSVPARVARALEPLQMGPKSIQAVPDKATPLHVAYVPVIGSAALLVFVGSGMAKAAGLDIALTAIDNAKPGQPALRTYDALAVAVSALAKARIAGDDLRIIASLATAGAGFVAVPALAIHFYAAGGDPAKALAAFKAKTGRNARVATTRPGSVPWLLLESWLFQRNAVPRDIVEIALSDNEGVEAALVGGKVDAATLTEPVSTILRDRDPHLQRIVSGGAMSPDLPGIVLGAAGPSLSARPEVYRKLVRGIVDATRLIRTDPAQASTYVRDMLGLSAAESPLIARALTSSNIGFVTDPRAIVRSTRALLDAEAQAGVFRRLETTAGLFDDRFFVK